MTLLTGQASKVKNYVNGAWVESSSGRQEEVFNPATGEIIAYVPISSREELDAAVRAASIAYSAWKRVAVPRRARYFFRYQQLLVQHSKELAELITLENGKSLEEALGEVQRGIECVESPPALPR